jgi:hypothetical protein
MNFMRIFTLAALSVALISVSAFASNDIDPNANFKPVVSDDFMDKFFGPIDLETPTGDNQLLGCEADPDGNFWITGGGGGADPNKLYKFTESGGTWTLVNTYDQPTHSTGWGWRDLVYCDDDGYLYGSCENGGLDQIDPADGQWTGTTIPGPEVPNRALAWDPATDHFWTANFSSNIYEFDRQGNVINSYSNTQSAYGMAWDRDCGNDPRLFVHNQNGNGMLLQEFDPVGGNYTGNQWDVTENTGIAGGAANIEYDWGTGMYHTLIVLGQGTPDFISGYELCLAGPPPDTNFSASFTINTPVVPSVNGDIMFSLSVTNRGGETLPCWAELYPTIGDCVGGQIFDIFDLKKRLHPNLPSGETVAGNYFYHVNDVSGLNLGLCAITVDVGPGPDVYLPDARVCDEFMFYNPWGRTGGAVVWGDDWYSVDENVPAATSLGQNYPNPFNATTTIPFDLSTDANVSLKVYNLAGQMVETLVDGSMNAGHHTVNWDASTVSSGVYFYKLQVNNNVTTMKMNLLK